MRRQTYVLIRRTQSGIHLVQDLFGDALDLVQNQMQSQYSEWDGKN